MTHPSSLLGLALLLVFGCSDGGTGRPEQPSSNAGQSAGGTAGASVGSAGADVGGGNTAAAGASTAGATNSAAAGTAGALGSNAGGPGAGGANGGASSALDAPDNAAELMAYLNAKQYSGWAKEATYHQSSGPHGDGVRVFYSPKAAAAVRSGALKLPAGAATVKELSSGGSLYGWAVWVKVQDATDNGNGFYWLEIIHQGGGKDSIYGDALGSSDCVGCHSAGKDYNLSTQPFQ